MGSEELTGEWAHIDSGARYEIVLLANMSSTQLYKFKPTVVYRSLEDNRVWARPLAEWRVKFIKV